MGLKVLKVNGFEGKTWSLNAHFIQRLSRALGPRCARQPTAAGVGIWLQRKRGEWCALDLRILAKQKEKQQISARDLFKSARCGGVSLILGPLTLHGMGCLKAGYSSNIQIAKGCLQIPEIIWSSIKGLRLAVMNSATKPPQLFQDVFKMSDPDSTLWNQSLLIYFWWRQHFPRSNAGV